MAVSHGLNGNAGEMRSLFRVRRRIRDDGQRHVPISHPSNGGANDQATSPTRQRTHLKHQRDIPRIRLRVVTVTKHLCSMRY